MPFDGIPSSPSVSQERFDWDQHFQYNGAVLGLDAASSVFFGRELEHIIPEMFEVTFAKINARRIFPIDRSAGGAVKSITWRQFTKTGTAQIVADYADDINIVDVEGEEFTTPVRGIATMAQWSIQEIRASQREGRQLDRMLAEAAREAMMREENRVAFNGDAAFGLQGLASAGTGIPQNAAPTGTWSTASADDIIADLNFAANTIVETTGDQEVPNTLLLPTAQYNQIASTKHGTDTDRTILSHFLLNNPYINEAIPVRELATAFGAPVMIAYDRNPSKIRMQIPLDMEQFQPQQMGLVVRVYYHMRMGGLTVHKPASLHVVTGIEP